MASGGESKLTTGRNSLVDQEFMISKSMLEIHKTRGKGFVSKRSSVSPDHDGSIGKSTKLSTQRRNMMTQ